MRSTTAFLVLLATGMAMMVTLMLTVEASATIYTTNSIMGEEEQDHDDWNMESFLAELMVAMEDDNEDFIVQSDMTHFKNIFID